MKQSKLELIIQEQGLDLIETTSEPNGYPRNLKKAIVGFKTFDQAKELAQTYGLDICKFHSRNGWNLWYRQGEVHEAMIISDEDYGDNYTLLFKQDEDDFIEDEVIPILEQATSFEFIEDIMSSKKEIWNEIQKLEEGHAVVLHGGNYYETIEVECMSFSEDTHNWLIGLINWG